MSEALKFLQDNKVFYLATVGDDNQAHVRPLGFVMEYKGRLAFCTSNQKDMYKQMGKNPKVEITCIDDKYNTLRLSGRFISCTNKESQQKALDIMPMLSNMYSVDDGKFEIFALDNAKAYCMDMTGHKKELTV